jgi:signal transduction histidine kinase
MSERIPEEGVDDEIGNLISTFNAMIARLDTSFEQMKQFSGDASHELRTPLTVIRTQLETALNARESNAETKAIIAHCLDEAIRMSGIIENLLLLAKSDAGQVQIHTDKVNLQELINETYEESIILASEKSITVLLPTADAATVRGDGQRLRQMLLNLIDNAIKYSRQNGLISLSLTREGQRARIVVADNGIGIPEGEIGRIFDRFYRVDRARSRELGGAGLGLSISRWIVAAHGGTISVHSELNKGSEFIVDLPVISA